MIDVSMNLQDTHELALFNEFVKSIGERRRQERPAVSAVLPPVVLRAEGGFQRADTPTKIDAGMLEAAITRYYKSHGLAAAKAFLAEYGVERVTMLPDDKQAEAYERLMS